MLLGRHNIKAYTKNKDFIVTDMETIRGLTSTPVILEFAEFVITSSEGRRFPDYKQLDLLKVPHLIPRLFTFDYRSGTEAGFLLHHSGTGLDAFFGSNITGKYAEDVYVGSDNADLILCLYRQGYETAQNCFAHRTVKFRDHSLGWDKVAESILFQCSSDDRTLNFAIGYADYTNGDGRFDGRYELF